MKQVISFPHLGNYYHPIKYILTKLTNYEVKPAPPITLKTKELGEKFSPSDACIPFKYNLGNFIESLDNGATILFQAGGGCRYRYYAEVQEKILRDLGYDFKFIKIVSKDRPKLKEFYQIFKKFNCNLSYPKLIHTIILTYLYISYMDKIDIIIRKNIGFSKNKKEYINLQNKMFKSFSNCNHITSLTINYLKYKQKFKRIKVNKPKNCLKVGIIGELYTSMEHYSSYYLEEKLATLNIEIKRYTNLSYLLLKKRFLKKHMLRVCKKYCKYSLGADGLDNVYRTIKLSKKYDGIIHIKPFGCTPEIGAIPIIKKVAAEKNIPVIFFSFDSNTSEEGINTRLEAFYDLIKYRKEKL